MSERLAEALKVSCRIGFLVGNVALIWLYLAIRDAKRPEDLPFDLTAALCLVAFVALTLGGSALLGTYLSFAMGVDVFGLNRLSGYPRGKPFDGLAPEEEERLRLRWTRGAFGRGANAGFKLLLTNRRLLAGSSLTSWYLLDISLEHVRGVERMERRFGPKTLRFHLLDATEEHRDISLGHDHERERLEEELARLGISTTAANS